MNDIYDLFFQTIRLAIGSAEQLSRIPSPEERKQLLELAKSQSLIGVCFLGLQKQREKLQDPAIRMGMRDKHFLQWLGVVSNIKRLNEKLNGLTIQTLNYFREKGFPCYVLKGQGIAPLYGELSMLRQSGDIDVWLNCTRKELNDLSMSTFGMVDTKYHHVHFNVLPEVEIEAHIYPSYLSSPYCNYALHRFCDLHKPTMDGPDTPSLSFNRVYILLHCYRHICGHGIGLRQFLDYYFVLKQGFTEDEREDSMKWIGRLGMKKFAEATMWIMKTIFNLEDKYLLCPLSEENGKFLLSEIIRTGIICNKQGGYRYSENAIERYLYNIKRDVRLFKLCPHECLWDPFFNLYQFLMVKFLWNK